MKSVGYLAWLLFPVWSMSAVLVPFETAPSENTFQPESFFGLRTILNQEALSALRSASRLDGQEDVIDMRSLALRIFHMVDQGMMLQALGTARLLVELAPDSAEAHRLLGHLLWHAEEYAEAVPSLNRALALDPKDTGALVLRGFAFVQQGALPDALEQFQAALESHPNSADLLHNVGVVLYRMDRFVEAIDYLERASAADPSSAASRHDLGLALSAAGRIDEAIASYEAALARAPGEHDIRRNLAAAWFDQGQPERAVALLAGVLLTDGPVEVWDDLILALRVWVGETDALDGHAAEESVEYYLQAIQHLQEGEQDKALQLLVRTFILDPQQSGPANDLGALLKAYDQIEAALLFLTHAAALNPEDGLAAQNIEAIRQELQQRAALQEAILEWSGAKTDPNRAFEAHLMSGRLHEALGDAQAARAEWRAAARLNRQDKEPLLRLALLEEALDRLPSAETAYRQALAIDPDDPAILLPLSDLLLRLPMSETARQEALALAEQANAQPHAPSPTGLRILAAAQAANGRYIEAARTARRGATLAEIRNEHALATQLLREWSFYQQHAADEE